jgi:hypothetical protein
VDNLLNVVVHGEKINKLNDRGKRPLAMMEMIIPCIRISVHSDFNYYLRMITQALRYLTQLLLSQDKSKVLDNSKIKHQTGAYTKCALDTLPTNFLARSKVSLFSLAAALASSSIKL